jgi:hypothetical protein
VKPAGRLRRKFKGPRQRIPLRIGSKLFDNPRMVSASSNQKNRVSRAQAAEIGRDAVDIIADPQNNKTPIRSQGLCKAIGTDQKVSVGNRHPVFRQQRDCRTELVQLSRPVGR